MIKKPPNKQQLSSRIASETQRYLKKGQDIHVIPKGVSSRDDAKTPLKPETWQLQTTSQERTYIPEVVETLEKRRAIDKPVATQKSKTRKPRKRLIYDDFGEPLRWVWVDD